MATDDAQQYAVRNRRVLSCRCGNVNDKHFVVEKKSVGTTPGGTRGYRWIGWRCMKCDAVILFSDEGGR